MGIDAQISIKQEALTRLKSLMASFVERRDHLKKENAQIIQEDIADIVQEYEQKNACLQDINQQLTEKQTALQVLDATIKKRSDDATKLEEEMRENSFESLRIRSEMQQFQSLSQEFQPKQLEFDN